MFDHHQTPYPFLVADSTDQKFEAVFKSAAPLPAKPSDAPELAAFAPAISDEDIQATRYANLAVQNDRYFPDLNGYAEGVLSHENSCPKYLLVTSNEAVFFFALHETLAQAAWDSAERCEDEAPSRTEKVLDLDTNLSASPNVTVTFGPFGVQV